MDRLRTLSANGVNLIPEFLTPILQLLDIFFDVSCALAGSHGVHFDCDLLRAKSTQNIPNAGFQEGFAIPGHA